MIHQPSLLTIRNTAQIITSITALYTIIITIWIFRGLSSNPDQILWLLPGGYLLEIMILSILAAVVSLLDLPKSPVVLGFVTGIFLAFSFWGEMTIGLFYFPAFLLLLIASILVEIRHRRKFLSDLWAVAAGVLGQSALIWPFIYIPSILQLTHFP